MNTNDQAADGNPGSAPLMQKVPELLMAALLLGLAALVISDSLRLGIGWEDDGPQSGYFPFYVGLMLAGSSGWVLLRTLLGWSRMKQVFAEREQLKLVMSMLVPIVLHVVGVAVIGLYAPSMLLIGWFMRRHGRFGWAATSAVSVGVPLFFFLVFERWFLVALPKGPIEQFLGL